MSQALFLKYRPQTFSDVVGQSSVIKTLQNSLQADKPVHSYLFAGSRGTGKTSLARLLAKGLNCENLQTGSPCGKCDTCQKIAAGSLVDVIEIDAASNRGIDEIRDLREKVRFLPTYARRKVYIIDEVHMLTKDASNALLKTLEEPPAHAFFILATTELHKILDTIISRCQTFTFGRFTIDQLVERLDKICQAENFTAEKTALALIAKKAEGGLRDAISALDQVASESQGKITEKIVRESLGISQPELLENFWQAIAENNLPTGLEVLQTVARNGTDFRNFGHDFLGFLREKMFAGIEENLNLTKIIATIEEIEKSLIRLKTSPITELPLEIALVKLTQNLEVSPAMVAKPKKVEVAKTVSVNPATPPQISREKVVAKPETADFTFDDEEKVVEPTKSDIENPAKNSAPSTPPTPNIDGQDLTADLLKAKMPEIAQQAGIPVFVKKSFLTTSPNIQGQKITFCAHSSFHFEQISSEKIRVILQKTINEMFQKNFEIEFSRGPASQNPSSSANFVTNDDLQF